MLNVIQEFETWARGVGLRNEDISEFVADSISHRGPIGTGRYACTCNNWGPRFIENSQDGCCPGCFNWALDHHQEMDAIGVKPVTMAMIERSTWGFNVAKIKQLKAMSNVPEDRAGVPLTHSMDRLRYAIKGNPEIDWIA